MYFRLLSFMCEYSELLLCDNLEHFQRTRIVSSGCHRSSSTGFSSEVKSWQWLEDCCPVKIWHSLWFAAQVQCCFILLQWWHSDSWNAVVHWHTNQMWTSMLPFYSAYTCCITWPALKVWVILLFGSLNLVTFLVFAGFCFVLCISVNLNPV